MIFIKGIMDFIRNNGGKEWRRTAVTGGWLMPKTDLGNVDLKTLSSTEEQRVSVCMEAPLVMGTLLPTTASENPGTSANPREKIK